METLMQLFGSMMIFVYHCFDRIVINGYLSMLSRPEQVVYFFKEVLKQPCITKEILSARTRDYSLWVDSYARNHSIPLEWAEAGVRKEDHVRPSLKKLERDNRFGVYFILKSMEQGNTFRSVEPKYPTDDPSQIPPAKPEACKCGPLKAVVNHWPPKGGGYSSEDDMCSWSSLRSSVSCFLMYSRMVFSSLPTVDTKYPLAQKLCPVKFLFCPRKLLAMLMALFPLMKPTTCATLYLGGMLISM